MRPFFSSFVNISDPVRVKLNNILPSPNPSYTHLAILHKLEELNNLQHPSSFWDRPRALYWILTTHTRNMTLEGSAVVQI